MNTAFFVWLREAVAFIWAIWFVKVLVSHVLLNLGVGIAASIYTNEFALGKVGEFLYRKLLPFILVLIFSEALAPTLGMEWLTAAIWVLIEVKLVGDLAESLSKLGVAIPRSFVDKISGPVSLQRE